MSGALFEGTIWLVGCGNMAGAMLGRWLECGLDPKQVTVIRKSGAAVADGVTVLTQIPPDGARPALVMLGVKPQMLDAVAPGIAPVLSPETILVSILAGVELVALRARFAAPRTIVRAMPNMPVALGKGVIGLAATGTDAADRARIDALMAPLGLTEWIEEALFDAVTALAGSGPAFLYRFIDALAAAGADGGLDAGQAKRLALATVAGAAATAAVAHEDPSALADRVASVGGSTRAGLNILDEPDALKALICDTITAAILRNRELAATARSADLPSAMSRTWDIL